MKLIYKNVGRIPKTFHGVTFKPNEAKEVTAFINDSQMIKLDSLPATKQSATKSTEKPASDNNKSASVKSSESSDKVVTSEADVKDENVNSNDIKSEETTNKSK